MEGSQMEKRKGEKIWTRMITAVKVHRYAGSRVKDISQYV
jgi:hypothetical protein